MRKRPASEAEAKPAVRLLAHRGGALNFPENTLAAFRGAVGLGADGVECDVRRTADGELVLFHDRRTDRLTGSPGSIESRTWREVRDLKVLGREPVPHLDDLLGWLAREPGPTCYFDLEVPGLEEVDLLVERIEAAGVADRCFVLTFANRAALLRRVRARSRSVGVSVMPLVAVRLLETARKAEAGSLCIGWNNWPGTRAFFRTVAAATDFRGEVARAREAGIEVTGGVANGPEDVRWFVEQGMEAVWTDDVRMAAEAVRA